MQPYGQSYLRLKKNQKRNIFFFSSEIEWKTNNYKHQVSKNDKCSCNENMVVNRLDLLMVLTKVEQ